MRAAQAPPPPPPTSPPPCYRGRNPRARDLAPRTNGHQRVPGLPGIRKAENPRPRIRQPGDQLPRPAPREVRRTAATAPRSQLLVRCRWHRRGRGLRVGMPRSWRVACSPTATRASEPTALVAVVRASRFGAPSHHGVCEGAIRHLESATFVPTYKCLPTAFGVHPNTSTPSTRTALQRRSLQLLWVPDPHREHQQVAYTTPLHRRHADRLYPSAIRMPPPGAAVAARAAVAALPRRAYPGQPVLASDSCTALNGRLLTRGLRRLFAWLKDDATRRAFARRGDKNAGERGNSGKTESTPRPSLVDRGCSQESTQTITVYYQPYDDNALATNSAAGAVCTSACTPPHLRRRRPRRAPGYARSRRSSPALRSGGNEELDRAGVLAPRHHERITYDDYKYPSARQGKFTGRRAHPSRAPRRRDQLDVRRAATAATATAAVPPPTWSSARQGFYHVPWDLNGARMLTPSPSRRRAAGTSAHWDWWLDYKIARVRPFDLLDHLSALTVKDTYKPRTCRRVGPVHGPGVHDGSVATNETVEQPTRQQFGRHLRPRFRPAASAAAGPTKNGSTTC